MLTIFRRHLLAAAITYTTLATSGVPATAQEAVSYTHLTLPTIYSV